MEELSPRLRAVCFFAANEAVMLGALSRLKRRSAAQHNPSPPRAPPFPSGGRRAAPAPPDLLSKPRWKRWRSGGQRFDLWILNLKPERGAGVVVEMKSLAVS